KRELVGLREAVARPAAEVRADAVRGGDSRDLACGAAELFSHLVGREGRARHEASAIGRLAALGWWTSRGWRPSAFAQAAMRAGEPTLCPNSTLRIVSPWGFLPSM